MTNVHVHESSGGYLNAWQLDTGATLGGWDTEHGEGWTSDGRNFTDKAEWQAAVETMAAGGNA